MDPVMRAARSFLEEVEERWQESPARVLPLLAEASDRGEVVKALRLGELAPSSRRPLFVYEAPFMEAGAYFDGLTEAITRDYEAVRAGVADEGVTLPEFTMSPILLGPLERAALAMERAAALSGVRFDGVTVALLPEQIADGAAWRESVRALDRIARSPRVRLAVHAPPGGPLNETLGLAGAWFHVHAGELLGFLAEQEGGTSKGPATEAAPEPREAQAAETGRKLRGLMLEAAAKMAAQEPAAAAEVYEHARALCAAEHLVMEEAAALLGLGGACVAAQAAHLAVESYGKAAALAEGGAAWELASLAWLGVGGACMVLESPGPAGTAYRAAANAAKLAGVAVLEAEARRMAEACSAGDGDRVAQASPMPRVVPTASSTPPLLPAASLPRDPADETLLVPVVVVGAALPFLAASAEEPTTVVSHRSPHGAAEENGHETALLGAFVPGPAMPFTAVDTPDNADEGHGTMMLPVWTPT